MTPKEDTRGEASRPEPEPGGLDLSLVSMFAGWAMADELQRRLDHDGHSKLRFADGFIIQQLVSGPKTIGEVAKGLEVTQQAASKSVADLERRGYVRRKADPADGRVRRVQLTDAARDAVEKARGHRAAIDQELADELGPRRVASARALLADVVGHLGADAAVRGRRVTPPR